MIFEFQLNNKKLFQYLDINSILKLWSSVLLGYSIIIYSN